MNLKKLTLGALTLALLLTPTTLAHAQTNLGAAQDLNLLVFNNHTQSGTDIHGRVAVGGKADYRSGGMTLGSQVNPSSATAPTLIVKGDYYNVNNSVRGDVVVGGTANWDTPTLTGDLSANKIRLSGGGSISGTQTENITSVPFDFDAAYSQLSGLSASLASLTATGSVSNLYNNLRLTATGKSLEVFNISASQLSSANYFGFEGAFASGATVIVNIDGPSVSARNFGFSFGGVDTSHLLFNFVNASSVKSENIGWSGSILAPDANWDTTYGQFNGTVVLKSLSGSIETHTNSFQGNLPSVAVVPEASSGLLVLAAAIPLLFGAIRTRRRAV
jgi:choice-of-anchor A domain-containing protein